MNYQTLTSQNRLLHLDAEHAIKIESQKNTLFSINNNWTPQHNKPKLSCYVEKQYCFIRSIN